MVVLHQQGCGSRHKCAREKARETPRDSALNHSPYKLITKAPLQFGLVLLSVNFCQMSESKDFYLRVFCWKCFLGSSMYSDKCDVHGWPMTLKKKEEKAIGAAQVYPTYTSLRDYCFFGFGSDAEKLN